MQHGVGVNQEIVAIHIITVSSGAAGATGGQITFEDAVRMVNDSAGQNRIEFIAELATVRMDHVLVESGELTSDGDGFVDVTLKAEGRAGLHIFDDAADVALSTIRVAGGEADAPPEHGEGGAYLGQERFSDGERVKTVHVKLIGDGRVEGTEVFDFVLGAVRDGDVDRRTLVHHERGATLGEGDFAFHKPRARRPRRPAPSGAVCNGKRLDSSD